MRYISVKTGVAALGIVIGAGGIVGGLSAASSNAPSSGGNSPPSTSAQPGLGAWCSGITNPNPHTKQLCQQDAQNNANEAAHAAPPANKQAIASAIPSTASTEPPWPEGIYSEPNQPPITKTPTEPGVIGYVFPILWQGTIGSDHVQVFAGWPRMSWSETMAESSDGEIVMVKMPIDLSNPADVVAAYGPGTTWKTLEVPGSGTLTITGYSGTVLDLSGARGGSYTYDASTGVLTTVAS